LLQTANTTDESGRYRFKQQPAAVLWNCAQMGQAMSEVMEKEAVQRAIDSFGDAFAAEYEALMATKLGLPGGWNGPEDGALMQQWLTLLTGGSEGGLDYTNSFRALCHVDPAAGVEGAMECLHPVIGGSVAEEELPAWRSFFAVYLERVGPLDEAAQAQRRAEMLSANPKFILRNYQAHEVICALEDEDDPSKLHRLLRVLERPFDEQPEAEAEGFAEPGKRVILSRFVALSVSLIQKASLFQRPYL